MLDQLLQSIPIDERKSKLINEMFRATALQLESMNDSNMGSYEEIFVDTAIKALQLHAKDLGVVFNSNFDLTQRRELIIANYRAFSEQSNEASIKSIISAFSNSDVEINKTAVTGLFNLLIIGSDGISDNLIGLKETVNSIVPAHLAFNFGTKTKSAAYACTSNKCAGTIKVYPWFPTDLESSSFAKTVTTAVIAQEITIYPGE